MIRSDNPSDNGVSGAMYLFGTALLWSFIGILVRANSQSALLIGAVTAIFMALFILLVGRPVLRVSRLIVLVAVCNFVTGTTFNFANQLTTVGNAIVLQYTSMIFVIVYQSLATRTLPSPAKIASVVVAFTGMGLFFLGDLSAEGMLGNLLAVISGATFGLCFFLNSRPDASPMVSSLISWSRPAASRSWFHTTWKALLHRTPRAAAQVKRAADSISLATTPRRFHASHLAWSS